VLVHEALEAAFRDHLRAWFPDHVTDDDGLHGPYCLRLDA
jgi:hypothetical protein